MEIETIITGLIITFSASLINFIATKIYKARTGININFIWRTQSDNLNLKSSIAFDELKKRTRLLVIDDEDSFPVKIFQSEGYSVDKWDKVENYGNLEKGLYDIIILDIKGVAEHISEEDGLGVLESLKTSNPAQIIIAFSQHSFDLSKARFWELADEKIAKPSDFLKIKKTIDNLIKTQFKPERYIQTLLQLIEDDSLTSTQKERIKSKVRKSIDNKQSLTNESMLKTANNSIELASKIVSLTNVISKFF